MSKCLAGGEIGIVQDDPALQASMQKDHQNERKTVDLNDPER